jgi:hypothetical protein
MIKRNITPIHQVGSMHFGDDGPDLLQVDAWYQEVGTRAAQWLVSIDIWDHEEDLHHDNPVQWDRENNRPLPEAAWAMTPQQARGLAELILKTADACELFQAGKMFREDD